MDLSACFVTSDPHGHRAELVAALTAAGLLDAKEDWAGGHATLWVLGDLMDRGPDGIGVVDLVMRLQQQAADAGGRVGCLLGNHEVFGLGMYRFRHEPPDGDRRALSIILTWQRNGGRLADQDALTPAHVEWLTSLPAMVVVDGHLLVHSDTDEYLGYGATVDEINESIADTLRSDDLDLWWQCLHRLTDRYAFVQPGGLERADHMMASLGARRMLHGHSIIADMQNIEPSQVSHPLLYGDRRILAIDGGMYAGGPCLVVDLARWPA